MFQMSNNSLVARYDEESRFSKALNITFWVLQGLLCATFLVAGTIHLAGSQMQIAFFENIGLGQWFRYFTGAIEVICAGLVLFPRTAVAGVAMLGITMVGAIEIHLLITGGNPIPSVVLLAMVLAVIWYRELYLKIRR